MLAKVFMHIYAEKTIEKLLFLYVFTKRGVKVWHFVKNCLSLPTIFNRFQDEEGIFDLQA